MSVTVGGFNSGSQVDITPVYLRFRVDSTRGDVYAESASPCMHGRDKSVCSMSRTTGEKQTARVLNL